MLWEIWALLLNAHADVLTTILALYQYPDLSETQPDAYKYVPLFLPLCSCQLGGEVGLFWVFSQYFIQWVTLRRERALLISWNA